MGEWQQKMSALAGNAQSKGAQLGKDAQDSLDGAWAGAKKQWHRLRQTSADGWDQARSSFERATQKMKDEWSRVHPGE